MTVPFASRGPGSRTASGFTWVDVAGLASLDFPEANAAVLDDLGREFPAT